MTNEPPADAVARAGAMTEFFRPLVPGQLGCVLITPLPTSSSDTLT